MLLASIGQYCTVQGKVKNDIADLFYAGTVLIALPLVRFCVSCVWISKHPPSSQSHDWHECVHTMLQPSRKPKVS